MTWIWHYIKGWEPWKSIPNFGRVDERLYRGGLPKTEGYEKLAQLGVKRVINLIDDNQAKERDKAERFGLGWRQIPMSDTHPPSNEDVSEFFEELRAHPGPFFVHCKGGRHRTGVMIGAYRMVYQYWSVENAHQEMKKYSWYGSLGHQPLLDWLRRFDREVYAEGIQ
jgi:tyrosine-protein phosphatase SIW14